MSQSCNHGKEMNKIAWCTCKFVVLSIKTYYFFAVLFPSPSSLVLLSSKNSATMVTWRHTFSLLAIFTVQNYGDRVRQILTTRYNLEFRNLTLYGITRPQSIRKSKQISGKTILSSPPDVEFNPNFAKNRDIRMVKNSVTQPVTPVLPIDTL